MQRLYQKIANTLIDRIQQGEYPLHTTLPSERELAKQLRVSRTSLREAIIALEVEGWVDVRLGSGVYVISTKANMPQQHEWRLDPEISPYLDLEPKEISPFSLLQARLLIEPEAAALAAENWEKPQLQAIKEAYMMNIDDNIQGSTTHLGDRLFHIRIAEASGNDAYADIIRNFLGHKYGPLFSTLQRLYTPEHMPMRSQHEHLMILMALEARDVIQARDNMATHIQSVLTMFINAKHSDEI